MVNPPRIPRGNVRERRLAQFMASLASGAIELVLPNCTEEPDTRPENPAVGRVIFTTDTKKMQVFDGEDWASL